MATTRLYLVRHGATQLTAEDRFAGDIGGGTVGRRSFTGRTSRGAGAGARNQRDLQQPSRVPSKRPGSSPPAVASSRG